MTLLLMLDHVPVPVDGRIVVTLDAPLPCPGDPECPVECDGGYNYTGVEWMGHEESYPCPLCHGSGLAPKGCQVIVGQTAGRCSCMDSGPTYSGVNWTDDPDGSPDECPWCYLGDRPAAVLYDTVLVEQAMTFGMDGEGVSGLYGGKQDGWLIVLRVVREFPPITEWVEQNHDPHRPAATGPHDDLYSASVASLPEGVSSCPPGLLEAVTG